MPAPDNPDVAWAVDAIRAKLADRQKALSYYLGDQPMVFTSNKFRSMFGERFKHLRDNLCDDVVNEPTNRLQITAWTGAAGARATDWWERNRGDARAGSTHLNSFRSGDGYVIVWPDANQVVRPYIQDPRQMAVRYSDADPDHQEVAAKCWREGKGYRLNLYYGPGDDPRDPTARIEHYYSKGYANTSGEKGIPNATAFLPLNLPDVADAQGFVAVEGTPWYEPHAEERSPVFHFPNGDLGDSGLSVLHDVYPLQDAYNKVLADFMVAGEEAAMRKRWATGVDVPPDPITGERKAPFKEEDTFWWTKGEGGKFGEFTPAEMKGFLDSMDALVLKIARKGGLPPHAVNLWQSGSGGGGAASGLSLLLAEGKLVKMVKDRQRDWAVVWCELVAFALTMEGARVDPSALDPEWVPAETRDETGAMELLVLKRQALQTVVPDAQFAREAGYTDEELRRFADEKEEETARKVDAQQSAFGGRISPAGPPVVTPTAPAAPGEREAAAPGTAA